MFGSAEFRADKVAIYIRWSTDEQGEGTTLEVQREACTAYAQSQGWIVGPDLTFVDDGWSGGNLDRPALGRLRQAIADGHVECVVVYKIDRLSRNVVDMVHLVLKEWEGRCYLKSARESIDTTSQQGKMFFYLLTSFAEWERSTIRERTYAGKQRRAQEGKYAGSRRPYGYAKGETPGSIVVVPDEAAVVRMMYAEYVKGRGANQIAKWLNDQGIPSRTGRGWVVMTVWQILTNPAYIGRYVWGVRTYPGRNRRPGQKAVVKNAEPKVVVEQAWEPIVEEEIWNLVQTLMREKPKVGRGQAPQALNSPALLTGIARCAACGSGIKYRKPQGQHKYGDYLCMGRFQKGVSFCQASFMPATLVDRIVIDKVMALYGSRVKREQVLATFTRELAEALRAAKGALRQVEIRLGGLDDEDSRLRREYRAGRITIEEYRKVLGDLEQDHQGLREERQKLQQRLAELERTTEARQAYLLPLEGLDRWLQLAGAERKQILRKVVQQVRLVRRGRKSPVEVEIVWRVDQLAPAEVSECVETVAD